MMNGDRYIRCRAGRAQQSQGGHATIGAEDAEGPHHLQWCHADFMTHATTDTYV